MRHLRYLELSGNPLAEETGYRLLVIKAMPWLEMLDMHRVGTGPSIGVRMRRRKCMLGTTVPDWSGRERKLSGKPPAGHITQRHSHTIHVKI